MLQLSCDALTRRALAALLFEDAHVDPFSLGTATTRQLQLWRTCTNGPLVDHLSYPLQGGLSRSGHLLQRTHASEASICDGR